MGVILSLALVCPAPERIYGFIMLFSIVLVMRVRELQSHFSLILDPFHSCHHGLCCAVKIFGSGFSVKPSEVVGTWSEAAATLPETRGTWSEALGIWSEAAATLFEAVGIWSEAAGGSFEAAGMFGLSGVVKISGSAFSIEPFEVAGTLEL